MKFPDNFGEIEDKRSDYDSSKCVIIPIPYEKTTSYVKGTINGPDAIIKASQNMELYDEELEVEIADIGICTMDKLDIQDNPEIMVGAVHDKVKNIFDDGKFPLIIGGEHSITAGCIKAASLHHSDLSVLQIDAHADLRDEYDGSKNNHACAMKRSLEHCKNIVQIGIRSYCKEESILVKERSNSIFFGKDIQKDDNWMEKAISKLSKNVYITFDLDGLDPSILPSTGTPEPGGLGYYQVLRFLKKVFELKNVVGVDVVELCPNKNDISSDFTSAKIIYKMIGYKFFSKR
jgi:agmatinase